MLHTQVFENFYGDFPGVHGLFSLGGTVDPQRAVKVCQQRGLTPTTKHRFMVKPWLAPQEGAVHVFAVGLSYELIYLYISRTLM
jgi:hypothetical protein